MPTTHFDIDRERRLVVIAGEEITLGGRAFDLLTFLAQQPGRVFSAAELVAAVWPGRVVEENNLRMQIGELRRRLGPAFVVNVAGRGYFLAAPTDVDAPTACPAPLPRWPEPLLGRASALDAVLQLLPVHRLVTVLGPGGIGKTRLALAAAEAFVESQQPSVGWVDLAGLANAAQVGSSIERAFELKTPPLEGEDTALRLGEALAGRDALLLLDNAEHLADSLAPLVNAWLQAAPALRVLVTSQRLLGVPGEQAYRLDPLALPPPGAALAELRSSPAIQLLLRRARAAKAGFRLDDALLPVAAQLCRRLDGIPLAIEMAAARLPTLGAEALNERLGERLRMLGSDQDALAQPRQRTLRAALDWSHALLSPGEQAVLRRLSVFAAPFRLAAAQRVGAIADVGAADALLAVLGLVDKSVVEVQRGSPPRYRLLESTRLYASQQLTEHAESEAARRCHAQAMARLAEEAVEAYRPHGDRDWLEAWQPDGMDWQAAFDHATACADAESAAPLGKVLQHLAAVEGRFKSIRRRPPVSVASARGARSRSQPDGRGRGTGAVSGG